MWPGFSRAGEGIKSCLVVTCTSLSNGTTTSVTMNIALTNRINGLKKISANATFNTRLMVVNGTVLSRLVYLITLWGGAQQYLLKSHQVQQLTAGRTVCGFHSRSWSKKKLIDRVGWLSVRQLIQYHTVLRAHKTIQTRRPTPLFNSISTDHLRNTRSAASGNIVLGKHSSLSLLLNTGLWTGTT